MDAPDHGELEARGHAMHHGPGATAESASARAGVQEPLRRLLAGRLSALYRLTLSALTPSLSTTISTRRFCWRAAAELLSTSGYFGPYPLVAIR